MNTPPSRLYRCRGSQCPGLPYRASVTPHPQTCAPADDSFLQASRHCDAGSFARYAVRFTARKIGALGIPTLSITIVVDASDLASAPGLALDHSKIVALRSTHEHITPKDAWNVNDPNERWTP